MVMLSSPLYPLFNQSVTGLRRHRFYPGVRTNPALALQPFNSVPNSEGR